ncbi:MAG: NAD(P)-dependent oxidoreductase [Patescibacteria group bacterium]
MKKKILITDSFFVPEGHKERLRNAGYEVVHLDKVKASEAEIIKALEGVSVYIIGGIEEVNDKVIESTDMLETIIFTGVDYQKFVPGSVKAIEKGIKILNAPGANAVGVAEFAVGVALLMQRNLVSISRLGDKKNFTTGSLQDSVIGLIGAGNIGQTILDIVTPIQPKEVIYYNRSEKDVKARRVELDELLEKSDIIFLTLPMSAGEILDKENIAKLKKGSLLVSVSPYNLIDFDALLPRLKAGEVRCGVDWPSPSPEFDELSIDVWYSVNSHSAYNTKQAINKVSDSVTETAIGLLK